MRRIWLILSECSVPSPADACFCSALPPRMIFNGAHTKKHTRRERFLKPAAQQPAPHPKRSSLCQVCFSARHKTPPPDRCTLGDQSPSCRAKRPGGQTARFNAAPHPQMLCENAPVVSAFSLRLRHNDLLFFLLLFLYKQDEPRLPERIQRRYRPVQRKRGA